MREGIECFIKIGELLGKDNLFYLGAMEGIDNKMNIEFEKYLSDPYTKEAMIAEATVQNISSGAYIDLSDIQKGFEDPHWVSVVTSYAQNTISNKKERPALLCRSFLFIYCTRYLLDLSRPDYLDRISYGSSPVPDKLVPEDCGRSHGPSLQVR